MTTTRAQWIADARAVLDLLESNPDLPLNLASGMTVNYYPLGNVGDIEAMAAVDAVADTLGVAVTPPGPGSHYEAEIRLGSAAYKAIAVLKDYSNRRRAIERLGEAALEAEEQAARPVEHVDYAEAEAVREIEEEMALEAAGVKSWDEL
jgi:lipopolysaccharide biosynthesis protein